MQLENGIIFNALQLKMANASFFQIQCGIGAFNQPPAANPS